MSEIMTFLDIARGEKIVKILFLASTTQTRSPNLMCKKKIFFRSFIHFLGGCSKMKTFYGGFFRFLVAQSTASPTTPCARRTDRNSWRNTSSKITTYSKLFVQLSFLNKKFCSNRSPAFPNRFQKFFLCALSPFSSGLIIFSEKTEQKNRYQQNPENPQTPATLCSIGN